MAADVSHGVSAGVPSAAPEAAPPGQGWTAGRVVSLVAGSILSLVCVVLLAGAGILTWADQEQQGGLARAGRPHDRGKPPGVEVGGDGIERADCRHPRAVDLHAVHDACRQCRLKFPG